MMHRGPQVNIWLQGDSERSKRHVNVTQVIKVVCLQKIRVCHWGLFLAFLVAEWSIYQSVVITALQVVLLCFLLPRFFFFNWNEERVKLGMFLCNSFMTAICGMLLLSLLLVPSFPSPPPPHICLPPVIPCLSAYLFIELFVYYAPPYLPAITVCAE